MSILSEEDKFYHMKCQREKNQLQHELFRHYLEVTHLTAKLILWVALLYILVSASFGWLDVSVKVDILKPETTYEETK